MEEFIFKAIGTSWSINVDDTTLSNEDKQTVLDYVSKFEIRFSRFLLSSEVNEFIDKAAGSYEISEEFAVLLKMADRLRWLTNGVYDPAAGELLEKAGYDSDYTLKTSADTKNFSLPHWSLKERELTIDGPIHLDLGGIGKGYCIDRVSDLLKELGYQNFLVDAGGDMFGTSKADGSPWNIAIQQPGHPNIAAGITPLYNQALAVSDSFRRRWGNWHHIVDAQNNRPADNIVGAAAISPSAWYADCMTSVLFLAPPEKYPLAAHELEANYLIFDTDKTCIRGPNWTGKLFE